MRFASLIALKNVIAEKELGLMDHRGRDIVEGLMEGIGFGQPRNSNKIASLRHLPFHPLCSALYLRRYIESCWRCLFISRANFSLDSSTNPPLLVNTFGSEKRSSLERESANIQFSLTAEGSADPYLGGEKNGSLKDGTVRSVIKFHLNRSSHKAIQ